MTQDTDSEEDTDSTDLIELTSFNQTSSESSTHQISVSEGLITVRRTRYQVEEEIAIMEVTPEKPAKSAVQKVGKFGGRFLKSLFDTSPAEVLSSEQRYHSKNKEREEKEAALKSSNNNSKSPPSSGSGGKTYTIAASASPPPHPPRKPTNHVELGGYEEPLCTPLYPQAYRKNQHRQDMPDNFITPGIRAYPKPREVKEHSKDSLEKDSPGRSSSSRTTSTETSSHSNNFESDFGFSTDSTGDRTSRREKERSQQALIDRFHAGALKMKLEKAEDEMLKLRLELDAYRSDSNSNPPSSADGGDPRSISRINSLDDNNTNYGDRRQHEPSGTPYGSAGRPDIAPLRSTLFVADGEDGVKVQEQDDSDREIPPGNWVDYQPELEILEESAMQVDNAWRSAQMYTFLQDAAAVNTVSAAASLLKEERSEKKVAFAVHKREQQPTRQSRPQSRVQSPTKLQQEQLQQQRFAQISQQQQQDPRYVHSRQHSRNEDNLTTAMQQHQHQQHYERSRSVETVSSTSLTATQQQRHVMQRTKSVESNCSSNLSVHSPTSSGQSYVASTRSKTNTTIAERINRTHNMKNGQQSAPETEIHRHPMLPTVSSIQAESAVSNSNFLAEPAGYRQPQFQPMSYQLEFDTHRQPQPMSQQSVDQYQPRQPHPIPQPDRFPRQPQSFPQPEPYNRQRQSHPMQQQDREQQEPVFLQPNGQQRLSQQQAPDHHQRSRDLTFPSLPQLNLDLKPSYENDEGFSSPLQLSPTSSGLVTPTGMNPPTAFQSDEERAAWQHQRTMERMYNARRNREALLLKQRGATTAR